MLEIVRTNSPAVFAIIGAVSGALVSLFGAWILKKTELRMKLWEKVIDHRIRAHEQVIEIACTLRVVTMHNQSIEVRLPVILESRDQFESWFKNYIDLFGKASTWLSTKVLRELNLLQDYMVNLYDFLRVINAEDYPEIGSVIKQDFITFSDNIEKLAMKYFARELRSLRLNNLKRWHKYPVNITMQRLNATDFFAKRKELEEAFIK